MSDDDKFAKDKKRKERELKRRYGVGKTEKNSDSKVKWKKIVAVLLTIVVVVGLSWMFKPWERFIGGSGEGENQPAGENVLFYVDANFVYRGSEESEPIDNFVTLRFPAPHIENEPLQTHTVWALYYFVDENLLLPQITEETGIIELMGDRTEDIKILNSGLDSTSHGAMITYELDKLYSREVFWIRSYVSASEEDENRVTLQVYGGEPVRSVAYWYSPVFYQENITIDLSFWARLRKEVNNDIVTVEEFTRRYDNGPPAAWYWLYSEGKSS